MRLLIKLLLVYFLQAQPDTILAEVMSKLMYIAFPDQSLEEVDCHFAEISGLPVVDTDHRCVGVLSKTDRSKASDVSSILHLSLVNWLFTGHFVLYVDSYLWTLPRLTLHIYQFLS